ncbi:hypothetical protein HMPREF1986_01900 [Oribacterium sp. oral taxon 078 str. F0263]|nr:hypothetical protein HMPREF1986_01900 [Oribacterium sp. oral taxon 078 str. F0263]
MKGAGRERPGREATRESLFMQEHDLLENHALRRKSLFRNVPARKRKRDFMTPESYSTKKVLLRDVPARKRRRVFMTPESCSAKKVLFRDVPARKGKKGLCTGT